MKSLNFKITVISIALLGLVQVVIPTASVTLDFPFDTTNLVHPTRSLTYSGLKTHKTFWHSELTSGGHSEDTHPTHPVGQDGITRPHFGTDTFKAPSHTQHGSYAAVTTGIHEKKFVVPSTDSTYTPPPACTQSGVLCLREDSSDHYQTKTNSWTESERSHHTEHPEPDHDTQHISGTRSFSRPAYTTIVHTTSHPAKARSENKIHECDIGCPDGFVCNTNDGHFGRFCVPDNAMMTVTWGKSPTPHNIHPRSSVASISYRLCLEGCPTGHKCSRVQDFDYLVCIPDNTATVTSAAKTGTSAPVHCTPHTITRPVGPERVSVCPESMQPHSDTDGTCICEPLSNPDGISSSMTRPPYTAVSPSTHPPMPRQGQSGNEIANRDPNPGWNPNIVAPCGVEQDVDQPDSWNGMDMVHNHVRYTCATGRQPLLLPNGTCDCIAPPNSYGGPGKGTKTFDTTFSTVRRTGLAPLGFPGATNQGGYHTSEQGTPASLSTPRLTTKPTLNKRATATPTPTGCPLQYLSLANPETSRPECPIYVTIDTGELWGTVVNKYPSLFQFCKLLKDPVYRAQIPLGVDLEPFKQELCFGNGIRERDVALTITGTDTAPAETINAAHPTPTNPAAPIYIQLYAGIVDHDGVQQPKYVTIYYPEGLTKFCEHVPHDTHLPHGVDLTQVLEEYCQPARPLGTTNRSATKRSLPPAQTIDATHPKPSNNNVPVWIKMGPSDGANSNVIVYADSLIKFCDEVGMDVLVASTLAYIHDPEHVYEEFCKGVPVTGTG